MRKGAKNTMPNDAKIGIDIRIFERQIKWLDSKIKDKIYSSRSHAVSEIIKSKMEEEHGRGKKSE